ncbi:putative chromate transport protein [Eubacterium plexicaudatum ASF492]|uniref:Chromate transporter n=1 Tax=Eubacterium plexicaudatum ASF492 TaxID=1235802 RepID=N2BDL2_9FIRM|nr:putative chromate transport protein [Eubacterium plexicaudatum ASF492]
MNAVWKLFCVFLKIGLFSIGGGYAVIPFIKEQVVEKTAWLSEKTFTDMITISQMTPGPLAVNTSTFVGLRMGGIPGALAATIGCILCGVMIALSFYLFFQKHRQSAYVTEVLNGLKSASLGLIMAAALTIVITALFGGGQLEPHAETLNGTALCLFLTALFLLRKWKINPVFIMAVSGIAGLIFYR